MVEDVGRQILFSGCAHARSGAPSRHAAIALTKALQLDTWEAPDTGCCGARADRKVSDEARQKALEPVYDGARQGLDITCLSPACGRVVAGFVAQARGDMALAASGHGAPWPIRVRDMVGLLHGAYGLQRLADAAGVNSLGGLRVAIHSTCHGDHNAIVRDEPADEDGRAKSGLGARLTAALRRETRERRETVVRTREPADPRAVRGLAELVRTVGANDAGDISVPGRCPEHGLVLNLKDRLLGAPASAPCLTVAAQAGADVVVTPCFLCYIGLNGYQKGLDRNNPARAIPVFYLAQLVGLACDIAPLDLSLSSTAAPARRVLTPYVI